MTVRRLGSCLFRRPPFVALGLRLFLIAEDSSLPAFSARAEFRGDLVACDGLIDHLLIFRSWIVAPEHSRRNSRTGRRDRTSAPYRLHQHVSDQESFSVRMEVVECDVNRPGDGAAFPTDRSIRNDYPFVYTVLCREDLPFP